MENGNQIKLIGTIVGIVVIVFIVLAAFPVAFVGPGERGVIFNNFGGIEDKILGEGLHFRIPFVQTVKNFSVKVQKNDVKAEAASKDLQTVSSDIVINWHIDAARANKVYQNIGNEKDVFDRVIAPAVSEVTKASTAQFTAEEVIVKRPILKESIDKLLRERLTQYSVILDDVSIVNVDFSPEFNKAIEAKSVALQNVQKSENDLKRIEVEAAQKIATAKAEAEAMTIKTRALEQNAKLVDYEAVLRWNGVLPTTMLGSATPFINVVK
jgi:regulator of protease activity HflC (stomatin/prohibitin superfamily)